MTETRNGKTFDQWMDDVNTLMDSAHGVMADEIPDWDYWDGWDAGLTATTAMRRAIQHAADF